MVDGYVDDDILEQEAAARDAAKADGCAGDQAVTNSNSARAGLQLARKLGNVGDSTISRNSTEDWSVLSRCGIVGGRVCQTDDIS